MPKRLSARSGSEFETADGADLSIVWSILDGMRTKEWQRGILIGFLLLVAFWLLSLIVGLSGKTHIAISEANEAKQQYELVEARKSALEANLTTLATVRGQDAAIRTAFGVARPGEEVIVVVPPVPATTTERKSWWQKILSWF